MYDINKVNNPSNPKINAVLLAFMVSDEQPPGERRAP